MSIETLSIANCGDPSLAHVFDVEQGKVNPRIKMTDSDIRNKTTVYCNEPYAQELFDTYLKRMGNAGSVSKDFNPGDSVKLTAKNYNTVTKIVSCEGMLNGVRVDIPISDFIYDVYKMDGTEVFDAVITKADNGAYSATCKNPSKYREELETAYRSNTWFDVKITSLIRGGYRALYKGTIECFIPGSHAAANIIGDFEGIIGKELPVMVDNYDWSSRMYVVSYKKYVKHSLPIKIHDIKFGHKYVGRLTSNPTEYGLFVEIDNYYTGLVNKADFGNYEEICKQYRANDTIDVYVKNITEKNGNYRVVLTMTEQDIDKNKHSWYKFKVDKEGKLMPYVYDGEKQNITIVLESGESLSISLPSSISADSIRGFDKIHIKNVNVLKYEVQFDFCN